MSDLLIGDQSDSYTHANLIGSHAQEGWKFTALATGNVTELRFRTNGVANPGTESVEMGIYSDNAGAPDILLGSGVVAGQPPTNTWITVTGLSIPVVEGEDYWLTADPAEGGLHFNTAVVSGGTPDWAVGNGSGPLTATWDVGSSDPDYADGPIGFYGLGQTTEPSSSKVEIAITTHHDLETETPAHALAWLHWSNLDELTIPEGGEGPKIGKVTVGTWTRAAQLMESGDNDYLYRLFIRVGGKALLWAPLKTAWDAKARKCTITAVDADRLIAHEVRDGDTALADDNGFSGLIPVDYRGLRMLRDAANNTIEQDTRFVAPLGIRDGTNSNSTSTQRVSVTRGAQVHQSMRQLAAGLGAVEFELEALDVDDPAAYPDYMQLNTFDQQGSDMSTGAGARIFHCNYGLRNLDNFTADPGKFVTHAHVLGDGGRPRVTRHHALSSRQRGVYVEWRATQLKVGPTNLGPLEQIAEAYIKAYGVPLHSYTISLLPIDLQRWVPAVDFGIGDVIGAGVKVDYFIKERDMRVVQLVLKNQGRLGGLTADVKVVPSLVTDEDVASGEE